jgi:hypothetical protein
MPSLIKRVPTQGRLFKTYNYFLTNRLVVKSEIHNCDWLVFALTSYTGNLNTSHATCLSSESVNSDVSVDVNVRYANRNKILFSQYIAGRIVNSVANLITLYFSFKYSSTEHPVVWLNKKRLELNEIVTSIGDKFTLVQTTSVTLELRSLLYDVVIRIRFTESGLQYIIVAPKEVCGNSVALGGSCDGLRNNDHNGTSGTPLGKLFRVLPTQSLFSAAIGYKDFSNVLTGAEYALRFTGVGITTDIIGEVFTESYVTVELLYLSFDGSGTLFTYSKENIFSIVLVNGEFCLRMNDMVNHTG